MSKGAARKFCRARLSAAANLAAGAVAHIDHAGLLVVGAAHGRVHAGVVEAGQLRAACKRRS